MKAKSVVPLLSRPADLQSAARPQRRELIRLPAQWIPIGDRPDGAEWFDPAGPTSGLHVAETWVAVRRAIVREQGSCHGMARGSVAAIAGDQPESRGGRCYHTAGAEAWGRGWNWLP